MDRIHADLSAPDLLGHSPMPSQVVLTGAVLTLPFDRAGQLLAHFAPSRRHRPGRRAARLENGQLSLQQEGLDGPLTLHAPPHELTPSTGGLQLQGSFAVEDLGEWSLRGEIKCKPGPRLSIWNVPVRSG